MANEDETVEMTEETETTTPTPTPPARGKPAPARREEPVDDPAEAAAERDRLRAALSKANKEAADRRRRLEELESAEEERKRASLSEMDRLKQEQAAAARKVAEAERRAADAEAALVRTRIDHAVERAAAAMGFEYPDIAPSLVDRDRVSFDPETGKVEGVKEALDRLAKDKPGLLRSPPGGGSPPRQGPSRLGNPGPRNGRELTYEEELRGSGVYGS